jgi:very-short-patch-repair endonuclease
MVFECDGRELHERTKTQAKRDRERDRLLQSFGFLVYRYAGQEI